jgi:hypothetical protein
MTTFANGESGLSVRTKINAAIAAVDRIDGYLEIESAAATTILDADSVSKIRITGTTTQTIVLPDVTTLYPGRSYLFTNDSTGNATIQSSGLNFVVTVTPNSAVMLQCILDTGTTEDSWIFDIAGFSTATGSGSVVRQANPTITGVLTAAAISGTSYVKGGYVGHAAGVSAMELGTRKVARLSPNSTRTLTTTVAPAGSTATLIIVTAGSTSYTLTFGTGFQTTGNLVTGVISNLTYTVSFVSDGTNMIETGRTVMA